MSNLFEYKDKFYPEYLKKGNAASFIFPIAKEFCIGQGVDVGGLKSCYFPDSIIVNKIYGHDALNLPQIESGWDYIFSSHCLEHLDNYIEALEHWRDSLCPGGRLFLYLPDPDMEYWRPENCRKHKHLFHNFDIYNVLLTLGFKDIIYSDRDLNWSFSITGIKNG